MGTNAEYMRTSLKVLPFIYFTIAYEFSSIIKSYIQKGNKTTIKYYDKINMNDNHIDCTQIDDINNL